MLKPIFFRLAVLLLASSFISCSSIKKKALASYLKAFKDKKAEGVFYVEPQSPYQKQTQAALDTFWWNPKTKSSISYFSSCSQIQRTLKKFQEEALPLNAIILTSSKTKDGLYTTLEIPHFDQKTYSGVHTLKKGNCYFNINLVSSSLAFFKKEEPIFKSFIKSFKITK